MTNCKTATLALIVAIVASADTAAAQPATPARDQKPAAAKGTAVIKGQVVDAQTGAGVRRVAVNAFAPGTETRAALTDDEGRFEIRDLAAGKYTLSVSRNGYLGAVYGQKRYNGPGTPLEIADKVVVEKVVIRISKGGVISGRVLDEAGEPAVGVLVRAQQYRFEGGVRRLSDSFGFGGGIRTDDLGGFRLYGLQPGQYYVNAHPQDLMMMMGRPDIAAAGTGPVSTYFPSTPEPGSAQRVTVAAGRETGGVNVVLVSTRLASIRGRALRSNGEPFTGGMVQISVRDNSGGSFGRPGGPIKPDGTFEARGLPVGTYHLSVQTPTFRDDDTPEIARTVVTLSGEDVDGIMLIGSYGGIARGRFVTDDGSPMPIGPAQLTVNASAASFDDRNMAFGGRGGRVADDYTFELKGLFGHQRLRYGWAGGTPGAAGWVMKAVMWDGHDITDRGLDFTGRIVDGISIVLTRKLTELKGTITDDRGTPAQDTWLIVFPSDPSLWTWQTRYVRGARVGPTGEYAFRGLPPYSEYLLAVTADVEQGQWEDPEFLQTLRERATRVSLDEGETKVQDLRIGR